MKFSTFIVCYAGALFATPVDASQVFLSSSVTAQRNLHGHGLFAQHASHAHAKSHSHDSKETKAPAKAAPAGDGPIINTATKIKYARIGKMDREGSVVETG